MSPGKAQIHLLVFSTFHFSKKVMNRRQPCSCRAKAVVCLLVRLFSDYFGGLQLKKEWHSSSYIPSQDSCLPSARILQAHNGLRQAQGEGKSSVTGKNILHFPLEQSRGERSVVGMEPIRNLSLIRNSDPLTRSSNLQAPLAHARERERCLLISNVLFSAPPECHTTHEG